MGTDSQAVAGGEGGSATPALDRGGGAACGVGGVGASMDLSAPDLGQLLSVFNQATARLSATHEALQAEVTRLRGELAEARGQVERSRHLALLGEMAAGIAHEVRNPLGSILLYARMLQQDLAGQPSALATAGKIAGAVRRLEGVVGDVLTFAREARPRLMELDARELLEHAVELARGDGAEWRGAEVVIDPGLARGGVRVVGDAQHVHGALVNLLRNAVEIMHERPRREAGWVARVELSAGRAEVLDAAGKVACMSVLSVKDTGPGVSAEEAGRLFTPFYTTKATGTGLGLAIVHRLVDAHGGRVSLRSWRREDGSVGGAVGEIMLPLEVEFAVAGLTGAVGV